MSNITAKTSSNAFYQARCKASTHNEQLSSREGAADIMSIDRGRLYRIESGVTNPYPEEILLTVHRWFANKSCPGNWLYSRLGNVAKEVTALLNGAKSRKK